MIGLSKTLQSPDSFHVRQLAGSEVNAEIHANSSSPGASVIIPAGEWQWKIG